LETNSQDTNEEVTIEDPKAVLSALERAKNDAKRFREEKEKLESDLNNKEELISQYSSNLLREKIKQRLSEEGIKDSSRVLKFMDMNSLQFDENLDVIGFEDQMEKLRNDLPEIFDPKLRVGGQADAAVQASVSTSYSASQLQAMKILGRL
jgi:hypothetical protein